MASLWGWTCVAIDGWMKFIRCCPTEPDFCELSGILDPPKTMSSISRRMNVKIFPPSPHSESNCLMSFGTRGRKSVRLKSCSLQSPYHFDWNVPIRLPAFFPARVPCDPNSGLPVRTNQVRILRKSEYSRCFGRISPAVSDRISDPINRGYPNRLVCDTYHSMQIAHFACKGLQPTPPLA